jgi:hypothetical protein
VQANALAVLYKDFRVLTGLSNCFDAEASGGDGGEGMA